jgi:hypothetical protein
MSQRRRFRRRSRKRSYVIDEHGNKKLDLRANPNAVALLKKIRREFIDKHGREPGPEDKLFVANPQDWDHFCDVVEEQKVVAPEMVYAMRKTQRMVTPFNAQYLTDEELEEWEGAVEEGRSIRAQGRSI